MLKLNETVVEKRREARCRRAAAAQGFRLIKSRTRNTHLNDWGGYQIVNDSNMVEYGMNFELGLDEVAEFLGLK